MNNKPLTTLESFFHDGMEFEDAYQCASKLAPSEADLQWLEDLNKLYLMHGLKVQFNVEQYAHLCRMAGA